jgi:hypothetical protein
MDPVSLSQCLTLLPTVEEGDPQLDIVAIHGLFGEPSQTWSTRRPSMWLRDFLPTNLPDARILSFGYDGSVTDTFQHRSLLDTGTDDRVVSQDLLEKLIRLRETPQERNRPIVVVGCSRGAFIAREALRLASMLSRGKSRYNAVLESTWGVVKLDIPRQNFQDSGYSDKNPSFTLKPDSCFRLRDIDLETFRRKSKRRRIFYELSLPPINLVSVMVMGNYHATRRRFSTGGDRLPDVADTMLRLCSLIGKHLPWISSEQVGTFLITF